MLLLGLVVGLMGIVVANRFIPSPRPSARVPIYHVDGKSLRSVFEGLSVTPTQAAYFRGLKSAWKLNATRAATRPTMGRRSPGGCEVPPQAWTEPLARLLDSLWRMRPATTVRASTCDYLRQDWGCPDPTCNDKYCVHTTPGYGQYDNCNDYSTHCSDCSYCWNSYASQCS